MKDKEILITGGTGSLGKTITKMLLKEYEPKGIRIFSRDELKQWQMKNELEAEGYEGDVAFLLGDVRDFERVKQASKGVDYIFNTAAMKQVPACEYNPIEALKTNVYGAENILRASIENGVEKVMHVSTDKAVYPINFYGVTKAAAEKLFIHGNVYSGNKGTKFSCCRYGNVLGSRGSIIPLFKEQYKKTGTITITHPDMTRFWINLKTVARFIIERMYYKYSGQIFIPWMKGMKVNDLARALFPDAKIDYIGIRKGEKLHECLITEEESIHTIECADMFIIDETFKHDDPYIFTSNNAPRLSINELKEMINDI